MNDPSAQTYTKEQAPKIVSENNGSREYNITPDNSNPEYMGNMNGTQTFWNMVTYHLYETRLMVLHI
ncbi:hypothetical protein BGL34_06095 [Fructilactobacillus lindneri]|uniref:Uncharacterized protein n=2 Tax=Fructilactobacillus lindneri TaxID=53444 RepID=A0A0R2K1Y4_9LACO|nr:hypothetical protein [Fructilactobacillus lindneri]ANZ57500.1 hypothetical protein AYR60_01220 [Fructilactobacillus lindneri]ANZ58768.1 hypothetical protein AYR59_01220 [Fructilactobacillus lindneri]KRN80487.1 hypothetical protein IV52_GL000061 [Fructilactobacillus lindneri DSM 20690 = JCM 11027]POG97803.1 hypothetical protein BGL31_05560 [Fructilactobacillus lindneri]POG99135.1 hypothetical protein BGL32_05585 [Fructilactobacillus lindneri]